MIRAGALFYAIAVSLIIALLSSSLIFYAYLQSIQFQNNLIQQKLLLNVNSGLNILLSKDSEISLNEKRTLSLFGGDLDSVLMERKEWGGFEICSSKAFFKENNVLKTALTGYDFFEKNETALYLCDLERPLSLCGNTIIKGTCYLPKSGIKRAYIEGQNFVGDKLIDGIIKTSQHELPPVNKNLLQRISNILENPFLENDSIINFDEAELKDSILNSFSDRTLLIHSSGILSLKGKNLSGNIILYSKKGVIINSTDLLNDILILAPKVFIEDNFTGNMQAFASDSIIVGKNCNLKYPSVLGIINQKNFTRNSTFKIGEGVKIEGILFAYTENSSPENHLNITIDKNAEISGQVYSNGTIDLKGSVYGNVFCKKFILVTPSSVYENHLLNSTIDFYKLSRHFVGISLIEQSDHKNIVKWVY